LSVTEAQRSKVYLGFRNVLEAEVADAVMELLPREGWEDVVRRSDLDVAVTGISRELDHLGQRVRTLSVAMWTAATILSASQIAIFTLLATRL
jgi:RecA/RadA recombinase